MSTAHQDLVKAVSAFLNWYGREPEGELMDNLLAALQRAEREPDSHLECATAVVKYFGKWRDSKSEPGEGSIDDILCTIAEDPSTITECIDKARAVLEKAGGM